MNKEFIIYEQALALKELGFDEPCLAFYDGKNTDTFYFNNIRDASGDYVPFQKHDRLKWFGAPLYQQAFRWFREKYNLDGSMSVDVWNKKTTSYRIIGGIEGIIEADSYGSLYDMDSTEYDSYEESEQECLNKLIELVKKK